MVLLVLVIRRVGGGGRLLRYVVGPVGDALLGGHVPVVGLGGVIVLGHVFCVAGSGWEEDEGIEGGCVYIYLCMPWEGHQACMRSERDADKEPGEEVRDESYRVIPPHKGEDRMEGTKNEEDVDGIKLGGLKIIRSRYLIPRKNKIK
jgi:hypothetical protein